MKLLNVKCKECKNTYLKVRFITVRQFNFCSKDCAKDYIINGFNDPFVILSYFKKHKHLPF